MIWLYVLLVVGCLTLLFTKPKAEVVTPKAKAEERKPVVCPDCGSAEFLRGPEAGMMMNIMCADCRTRFNLNTFSLTMERI